MKPQMPNKQHNLSQDSILKKTEDSLNKSSQTSTHLQSHTNDHDYGHIKDATIVKHTNNRD